MVPTSRTRPGHATAGGPTTKVAAGPGRLTKVVAQCALLAFLATFFVTAAASPASATTVSPVKQVPGTTALTGVACPTATCIAVGYTETGSAVVVPVTSGTPGAVQTLAQPDSAFGAVACSSATTCFALGTQQVVIPSPVPHPGSQTFLVPITNGVLGSPQPVPGVALTALTCASATTCYAVGDRPSGAVLVPIVDGTPGPAQAIPGIQTASGVACASSTTCYVTGSSGGQGVLVQLTNGVAAAPETAPGVVSLAGIACPSATTCFVVGSGGADFSFQNVVLTRSGGSLGTPKGLTNASGVASIACLSATTCEAVGSNDFGAVVVPVQNGVPGAVTAVAGAAVLNGVACPGPTTCVAVGFTFDGTYKGVVVTIDEPPTGPSACKNGGWQSFRHPAFKSQAACVSYLQNLARCARLASRPMPPGGPGSDAFQRWFQRFTGCRQPFAGT